MPLPDATERWTMAINEVTIGAGPDDGGTRKSTVRVGGEKALPYMHFEGPTPNRTVVAMEVWDCPPADWAPSLVDALGDVVNSPAEWAKACEEKFGAEMICLTLKGAHPEFGDASPDDSAAVVKSVLAATGLPLIIWGCDHDEKDNLVLPKCSQAAAGERCLIGTIKDDNYKTLTAACLADGHNLIGESPIDINIAKQVNILASDMGFPLERMVMFPSTGALGYGIEYVYSIQERGRLAALGGDKMMAMPVICQVGQEAWRAKEAKATAEEFPQWGNETDRGALWEMTTAVTLLQAGADIIVMRHPKAVAATKKVIAQLMKD
ncbi:MAG: acetyl-CoA decarbonylase/synthase complex subunit delta [Dehalococcoidia bacterium]|nr:acetyl-CoA decarbonylase/synthase complex subunit delta [Dehalococcoidia bacterium]